MNTKLNPLALGYAGAVVSALGMFVMWLLGTAGFYMEAVMMMQGWHMFFSLSVLGLIGGVIEAAVFSFVILYLFGWLYNRFAQQ